MWLAPTLYGAPIRRETEALVIFAGIDHYITPSWYATKRENGKVVPTWNYVAVHAFGPLQVFEDRGMVARAGRRAHRLA